MKTTTKSSIKPFFSGSSETPNKRQSLTFFSAINTPDYFDLLPDEVLLNVLDHLEVANVFTLIQLSKRFLNPEMRYFSKG